MILAVDTETTGLDRWHGCRPFLVTACDGRRNYYSQGTVNLRNRLQVDFPQKELEELQQKLEEADTLVFHNAKFDLHMLESSGINLEPLWPKIEDTLIASHALCSGEPHGLKYLAFKYLDYPLTDEEELGRAVIAQRNMHPEYDIAREGHPAFGGLTSTGGKKVSWHKMDYWLSPKECLTYGMGDVERTWLLWECFYDALQKHDLVQQYETRKKLIRITFDMEKIGYTMYADQVKEEIEYLTDLREALSLKIQKEVKMVRPLNLDKDKDKRFFLFSLLNLKPAHFSAKTGQASLNKEAINYLIATNSDIPAIRDFQEYRVAGTQIGYLSSYLKWNCPDNRIRGSVFITGTRNTRQSYKDPNLQNIDKRLTNIFGPPPGYVWLDFDLVSIEPRIWAYLTGNKELIGVLEAGKSPHLFFASLLFPEQMRLCELNKTQFKEVYEHSLYKQVKAGGLAIMYGAQHKKADTTFGKAGAYAVISERMPELPRFNQDCTDEVLFNLEHNNAPYLTCLGGYRLDVPLDDIFVGPNYKIQGTAGWIIGEAMINVKSNPDYIRTNSQMVVQVHDSIKIEIKESLYDDSLRASLQNSIEEAGLKYLPTCKASYKLIRNEQAPF